MSDLDRAVGGGCPRLPRCEVGRGCARDLQPADPGARRAPARRGAGGRRRRGAGGDRGACLTRRSSRPYPVAAAMAAADVVLAPTVQSLSHTAVGQGGERPRCADRDAARSHRGDARPGDERRHGGAATQGPRDRRRAHRSLRGAASRASNGSDLRLGLEGNSPRSQTPARLSRASAPSETCPPGKASSPPSRGRGRGTARCRRLDRRDRGSSRSPSASRVEAGHLTDATGAAGARLHGAAYGTWGGGDERRRARHRLEREGDPDRRGARRRATPRASSPAQSRCTGGTWRRVPADPRHRRLA